jgi:molybdenum cofactor synthesis domain-containing protein
MTHQHDRKTRHAGFEHYIPVDHALKQLLLSYSKYNCFHPKTQSVNLQDATNRVLAEDFIVPLDIPPFTRGAMDGYAVIASDTKGASNKQPITLEVVGKTFAGDTNTVKVSPGKAVAIATGGRIPQGADAVVMVEYTSLENGKVQIFKAVETGKNVAKKGEDLQKGTIILKKGTWLKPQDVGLIASVGIPTISVICKPKVAVFSTGSELVTPGSELKTGAVLYDSNRYMLSAMINEVGGEAVNLGICKDDENAIMATLKKALQYDLVVMSGGSSVGEKDFVPDVISSIGKPGVLVHGVAMRPGSPTALSMVEGKPVISTPGYPVACYFAFYTFGKPLLLRMLGTAGLPEAKVTAKMASGIKLHEEMQTFLRINLKATKDRKGEICYVAEPVSAAAASIQRTLTGSDGVVIVNKSRLVRGQKVEVHLLRALVDSENAL